MNVWPRYLQHYRSAGAAHSASLRRPQVSGRGSLAPLGRRADRHSGSHVDPRRVLAIDVYEGAHEQTRAATVDRGWAAWNIEYRRMGMLGGGGGWPSTYADISAAVDHVARLPGTDPERVITCGHSSGGCFALWAAAGSQARRAVTHAQPVVLPLAAVSLAGVVDLLRGHELGLGDGAVSRFLGGSPEDDPGPYQAGSPAALLPLGVPQILVHGLSDTTVPPSMSSDYQKRACELGDDAVYEPQTDLGHRDLIDPSRESWPVIAGHLERLFSI